MRSHRVAHLVRTTWRFNNATHLPRELAQTCVLTTCGKSIFAFVRKRGCRAVARACGSSMSKQLPSSACFSACLSCLFRETAQLGAAPLALFRRFLGRCTLALGIGIESETRTELNHRIRTWMNKAHRFATNNSQRDWFQPRFFI